MFLFVVQRLTLLLNVHNLMNPKVVLLWNSDMMVN